MAATRVWMPAGAVVVGLAAVGLAALSIARGGSGETQVIRQVFTDRSEYTKGATITVAETWTLLGSDGGAEAFVGRYFNPEGQLIQGQYRTPEYELVFWATYEGSKATCVEKAPPAPRGLQGLVPEVATEAELRAAGFTLGGQAGPGAVPVGGIQAPRESPAVTKTLDVNEASVWSMTVSGPDGVRRVTTRAVDGDGIVAGSWSVTYGSSGAVEGSNSRVLSLVETYDASVFERILAEVDFDDAPSCN